MNSNSNNVNGVFKMRGDWKIQSTQLKNRFAQLTDEDLEFEEEKEKDLLRRLEKKLNLKTAEVIEIIKSFQPEKRSFIFSR